jgi:hypothetical protein
MALLLHWVDAEVYPYDLHLTWARIYDSTDTLDTP